MLSLLCATGVLGFIEFLKSAVFVVRIHTRGNFISRATIKWRGKKLFRANGKGRWRSKKYFDWKELEISSPCG